VAFCSLADKYLDCLMPILNNHLWPTTMNVLMMYFVLSLYCFWLFFSSIRFFMDNCTFKLNNYSSLGGFCCPVFSFNI